MIRLFTSESVTEGHPDKVCDQISDAILDAILAQDKNARVACECSCTEDFLLIMGEITTTAKVDYEQIAREKIKEIGYIYDNLGFDYKTVEIKTLIKEQSPDIALGVDKSAEAKEKEDDENQTGAGDQGLMFGFANSENEYYMPSAIMYSHLLCQKLAEVRKNGQLPYLRPDGKGQVTVAYDENRNVKAIETVVVSTQHADNIDHEQLENDIKKYVINPVLGIMVSKDTKIYINPTGNFVIGGPKGDCGLTGRKIVVDTYGGYIPHGGGAFSGKDPTKVDRSAAYFARYVAKNLVAAKVCKECQIQVAYAIGVATPVSIDIDTHGTGIVSDEEISEKIKNIFDFRPKPIIDKLGLRNPVYGKTAAYGHFGRDIFPWEKLDMVENIKKVFNI
ncbi:MAG: methionine adenosyltransferase [Clostridia bacterium]|nr:methionine adenosyltransferase [Clostridia bacterium]